MTIIDTTAMADRIRPVTRLLADMQTTINAAGLRVFGGDMTRFVVMTVILRGALADPAAPLPVSINALAASLSRPFETMRRHVNALADAGLVERRRDGVAAMPGVFALPAIREISTLSHDAFVRLVADARALGLIGEVPVAAGESYDPIVGIEAAIDVMLGTAESNNADHGDWLNLVLFSTILHGNLQRGADLSPAQLLDWERSVAIRPSVVARALSLPETTTRRRLREVTGPGRPVTTAAGGYLVSLDWLATPQAAAISEQSLSNIRRIVYRVAARGFPVDAPERAYLVRRPPSTRLD